ncbi:3-isopropylmalate dehydratase large subunit [Labilithrix luteola]|uniref:3-isopropylmalate dehydratase large subunit n=1 Tax=Labilithrix luteola TaxID=1391654 RepID=A0A0K1PX08_9BACT|nr:aconitase family protein [Labilithrix luteola]AKU98065.1 3-isopropylmalate dehydratase large subunit [Labilithrix luteola]
MDTAAHTASSSSRTDVPAVKPSSTSNVTIGGRVLFVTEDLALLEKQLAGEDLPYDPERPLVSNISTDELTPGWVCYYYDETLARFCLVGLRGGKIGKDAIKNGGFGVIVSGISKGCGSSRETAPYSELKAGVKLVIAKSIEKIYRQNAQNIGLLTSTDFGLIERIRGGEAIPMSEFTKGLDPISAAIVEHGGLFAYNRARLAGETTPPAIETPARPMTLCEKILAAHVITNAKTGAVGVTAVQPGDAFFARTDVRFSHEYVTPMAESLFSAEMGKDARVTDPESVWAFRDHLTFLDLVMPKAHRDMGLKEQAEKLAVVQDEFTKKQGVKLYGEVHRDGKLVGSEAICHNKVIEEIALPGQLVAGTDSHTCMAGALGCFAFGVGSTDMANAWYTKDIRVTVPETARFVLRGKLRPGVCAKDVMLHILSQEFFKSGQGIGKVLEFAGDGVASMNLDERATLTNMAVEAGGFTGIIEADEVVVDYLVKQRGLDAASVRSRIVKADPGASYLATFEIDLAAVEPMVATPGDPRNGVPLRTLGASSSDKDVRIDIAYGGSCTGGKKADMDMYAAVLSEAVAKGKKVADGVHLYIQFGSQDIRRYAEAKGYLEVFRAAGAELVDPSCGACIKAGPGVSDSPEQVTVSAINRNFPGRSGPGKVYLASPLVVAASAIAGRIVGPDAL